MPGSLPALFTGAEDCQMLDIGFEAVLFQNRLFQRIENRLFHIYNPAAFLADKVMMMPFFYAVVAHPAVPEIGFRHQFQLL
jgi:hypothetical protein